MLTFVLADQTGPATIDAGAATVAIEVDNGTGLTSLSPTITISDDAAISPTSGTPQDFSSAVTYTVTAQDGSTKDWTVNVTEAAPLSDQKDMLTFVLADQTGPATIDAGAATVAIEVDNGTGLTSLSPTITISDDATISPTSGTPQDFSSAVTYTVTAQDGSTKDWTVNVTEAAPLSDQKDMLTFVLADQTGPATIDAGAATVAIEVDNGTGLTSLSPTITISDDATISPTSGTPQDFSSAVTYTVTAQDGSTKDWTVNVTEAAPLSDQKDMLTFVLADQTGPATIDAGAATVAIEVDNGTGLTSLSPTITISDDATISPTSGTPQDFSSAVTYTVTAQDGSTKDWTVNVTEAAPLSDQKDMLTFVLADQTGPATIDAGAATVAIEVDNGTGLTSLSPTITISDDATISPTSGTPQDFSSAVTYTVTAQDGSTKDWTVNVTEAAPLSDQKDMLTFVLADQTGPATIDAGAATVAIEVDNGTGLTSLSPTITISDDATISPTSGTPQDFSSAVTYTVTAQDGSTKDWTVNVTEAAPLSDQKDMLTFVLADQTGPAIIDAGAATVAIEVDNGTGLTSLSPTITISDDATISPTSGTPQDFSSAVTYTVTAQDGSTKDWTVNVTEAAAICSPISTLACSDIPVSVPFTLDFTGLEGGLEDNNADQTGFTMVMHPSAPIADAGTPADSNVPGYVPAKLDVNGGNLIITSSKGLFYRDPSKSNNTNSQINGMGVGMDASSGKLRFKTTIVNPEFNLSTSNQSQQAGIWFGTDEDNVVKVALAKTSSTAAKVQLVVEDYVTDGNSSSPSEINSANLAGNITTQSVTLILEIDQTTGQAQAFYQLNGGAEVLVENGGDDFLPLGAHFFTGTDHDASGATPNISFGGVFSSLRNANATPAIDFSFSDFSIEAPANINPTADAGPDQTVIDTDDGGDEAVTLDGAASTDSDGTIATYSWVEGVTEIATGVNPTVTLSVGVHTIVLTVTDDEGATATDEVVITVNAPANINPTADAGPDQTVIDTDDGGDEAITLDGSASTDSDGTIATYSWVEGVTEIATGVNPTVTLSVGVHTIVLTVTDDEGATATDEVVITVNAPANINPTADAGPDQTVIDTNDGGDEAITLDGSASTDSDGTIATYSWVEGVTEIATGVNPTVTLSVGVHTIVLTVTDDEGATATDEVVINVNSPTNINPTADAGPDQTVIDTDDGGDEAITLDGSASTDSDGTIATYSWVEGVTEIATGVNPTVTLSVGVSYDRIDRYG